MIFKEGGALVSLRYRDSAKIHVPPFNIYRFDDEFKLHCCVPVITMINMAV